MKLRTILPVLLVLPFLQGCIAAVAAVAATVGYVQYERNELSYEIPLPQDRTWRAVGTAVDDLGYPTEDRLESVETTESTLEVLDLWVRVERLPAGESRLLVRVGTFATKNHKRRGQLVVEKVFESLHLDPPIFEEEEPEPVESDDSEPTTESPVIE